jgi:hypothetical protein
MEGHLDQGLHVLYLEKSVSLTACNICAPDAFYTLMTMPDVVLAILCRSGLLHSSSESQPTQLSLRGIFHALLVLKPEGKTPEDVTLHLRPSEVF